MLEYDNSAFYYFAITLISIYLLPGTWYALSEIYKAFIASGEAGTIPRTDLEKEKAAKLKRERTGFARLQKYKFVVNLVLLVIAFSVFIYLVQLVKNDGEVNTFDPYRILGIEQGITMGEIKKAYRKLSLRYHPDKNIGDKLAEEMFMKIAKAYEALTDETSKENYEKYGNPDGKQSLEVSIGLPKILLDNPKVVLVLYLVAMVVVIPVVVGLWYANSKQYGENDIKYESYTAFYQLIQETHRTKHMPEVMAASAECRALNATKPGELSTALLSVLLLRFHFNCNLKSFTPVSAHCCPRYCSSCHSYPHPHPHLAQILPPPLAPMPVNNPPLPPLPSTAGDNESLKPFYQKMKGVMQEPKFEHPVILRGNLLVHAHVLRLTSQLNPVRSHRILSF